MRTTFVTVIEIWRRLYSGGASAFLAISALAISHYATTAAYAQQSEPAAPSFLQILEQARGAFLSRPVRGEITRPFGAILDPATGRRMQHRGTDYGAPAGAAIVAAGAGRVTRVERALEGYGTFIEIDHGNGLLTRYAHLGFFDVRIGDHVAAGQIIAQVGRARTSRNGDFHFEVLTLRLHPGEEYFIDPETVIPTPSRHG